MKKILLRFDDICPTMDFTQWKRAEEIIRKYDIKPLLGVIPDCKDPVLTIDPPKEGFWEWLLQLQNEGYTLAMHGYHHEYDIKCRGLINNGMDSEFAGHSLEEQMEKITKGKECLLAHGIETDIFFAPSHSYDKNTLRALSLNGFHYMSDAMSNKPYFFEGLKLLPCGGGGLPGIHESEYYTYVFHAHEWTRPDKSFGYDELVQVCEKSHDEIVPFNEFKEWKAGGAFIQKEIESVNVYYERKVHPTLSKVKHMIVT